MPLLKDIPPNQMLLMFALAAVFLAIVIIVARQMAKGETIHIPRHVGQLPSGDMDREEWAFGEAIGLGFCPDCHQEGFYSGPSANMAVTIYCGNPDCRHGFRVTNYGRGLAWGERIDDGPDRLYSVRKKR